MNWKRLSPCLLGVSLALGLATTAYADLRTVYQAGPIMYPGADPDYPQQAAVNKNIGSPYYGYLYIADYRGAADVPKMIHIWKPVNPAEGTGATEYVDTGLEIATPDRGLYDPFAVAVGSDDTVWIGEYGTGVIASAPPVPPSGTSITAVPQVTGVGSVRGLRVVGPVTNAQVYAAGTTYFVKKYNVSATDALTAGTFELVYNTSVPGLSAGPYGPAVDLDGNVYLAAKGAVAGSPALIKLDPTGAVVPFSAVIPPNFITTSDASSAGFVKDPSYPGGGYLYSINRTSSATNGGDMGMRFDLNGNYLDGYGPAVTPAPANYTVLSLARNNTYGDTDDLGNVIQKVSYLGNGAYQKVIKKAPFVVAATEANSAGAPVKSSPTAVDGVVYFGADDGKLYAYTTADGNPVSGFPVDINAAVGATVTLLGRPSVYFGTTGKAIYLTTNRGDVVKVLPDGTVGWAYTAKAGAATTNAATPAVTDDGWVVAAINGVDGIQVIKMAEDNAGTPIASPVLGTGSISNAAVAGGKVYVGVQGGTTGDLLVLNLADLSVLASFAAGEGVVAPPHVKGPDAYVGTLAGKLYKINSATTTLDTGFGTAGAAEIGESVVTDAFPMDASLYVGTDKGKVFDVSILDGTFQTLYDTTNPEAVVGGLVVHPDSGTIAFGASTGVFYQIPAGVHAAQVFQGYGAFSGTPTFDRASGRFFIGSADQNVYAFNSR